MINFFFSSDKYNGMLSASYAEASISIITHISIICIKEREL